MIFPSNKIVVMKVWQVVAKPQCKNCVHYMSPLRTNNDIEICKKFGMPAKFARKNVKLCGPFAIYFER